jgi:hypothetical protein
MAPACVPSGTRSGPVGPVADESKTYLDNAPEDERVPKMLGTRVFQRVLKRSDLYWQARGAFERFSRHHLMDHSRSLARCTSKLHPVGFHNVGICAVVRVRHGVLPTPH